MLTLRDSRDRPAFVPDENLENQYQAMMRERDIKSAAILFLAIRLQEEQEEREIRRAQPPPTTHSAVGASKLVIYSTQPVANEQRKKALKLSNELMKVLNANTIFV